MNPLAVISFYFAIACSLLSQVPAFLASGLDVYLKLSWVLPAFVLFLSRLKYFFSTKLAFVYAFLFLFVLLSFILESVTGNDYTTGYMRLVVSSCLILITSFVFWNACGSEKQLHNIAFIYLAFSVVLALSIYYTYLAGSDIYGNTYLVRGKNSYATILLAGSIIALLAWDTKGRLAKRALLVVAVVISIVVMFLTKSRATIAGFLFAVLYFVFMTKNKKARILTIILCIACVVYLFASKGFYDVLVNSIILSGRSISDLDDVSSGRVSLVFAAIETLPGNLWFGSGFNYLDCFPIAIVCQYGIIGSLVVFAFLFKIGKYVNIKVKRDGKINTILFLLFWIYFINSLFEAYAPFGTGVKCMPLWMILGFSLACYNKNSCRKHNQTSCT